MIERNRRVQHVKKKYIIYALGKVFQENKCYVDWTNVIAAADKKVTKLIDNEEIPCIKPNAMKELEYDYVAIFSDKLFEVISKDLVGEYGVPYEKIISWKELLNKNAQVAYDASYIIVNYIKESRFQKVLDMQMKSIAKYCLTAEELFFGGKGKLDGISCFSGIENASLYDHLFYSRDEIIEYYDVVILDVEREDVIQSFEKLKEKSKEFIVYTTYSYDKTKMELFLSSVQNEGWTCKQMHTEDGILWSVKRRNKFSEKDICIYVVTHKEYNIKQDELYQPICVGDYWKEGYFTELKGENIAYLNNKINECTALYWIWKNTTNEYVGLNHYRRYFYNHPMKCIENRLTKENIVELLEEYDIILPETCPIRGGTELQRIKASINSSSFEEGYRLVRAGIQKHQPDYLVHFDNVMNGSNFFPCNMFVTSRKVLNDYCEWLFSFLIEAAEKTDVTDADNYSKRVIGFFAERMWTVWLRRQNLRIKQLPFDAMV